jgi:DNA-binding HxlR family transcriptional regulator
MELSQRSGCPINLTLELLGDRWSLIVIRDIMFGGRRHFRELITQSEEGIASNVLADRLKRLVENGLLSKRDDPAHKQKAIYSLTEASIDLVPLLIQIGAWAAATPRQTRCWRGGPKSWRREARKKWKALMAQLKASHIRPQST